VFNHEMIEALRRGPLDFNDDVSAAIGLLDLVHRDLEAVGTGGGERLSEDDITVALLGLRAVLKRLGVTVEIPFRNYSSWTYWLGMGASGSWQARRQLLADIFDPIHARMMSLEERMFEGLAEPVSRRRSTGWPMVDIEVDELRRRFRSARGPQDYRGVGGHAVGVLEPLSNTVYNPARHVREGETPLTPDKTKLRLERYVETALTGPENVDLRALVRASRSIGAENRSKERVGFELQAEVWQGPGGCGVHLGRWRLSG
jgi:hypothetical protein